MPDSGSPSEESAALRELGARIDKAKAALDPPRKAATAGKYEGLSLAWRMVVELCVGVGIGAFVGYWADRAAGWFPLFTLVFGALGFVAGVKTMLRSAKEAANSAQRNR